MADATPIFAGDNSIDTNTGGVERALPWAAGVRWGRAFGSDDWTMDLYATSTLGRTAATSLLVAPDESTAFGLSLTYQH